MKKVLSVMSVWYKERQIYTIQSKFNVEIFIYEIIYQDFIMDCQRTGIY
jgi:hypothetical protein